MVETPARPTTQGHIQEAANSAGLQTPTTTPTEDCQGQSAVETPARPATQNYIQEAANSAGLLDAQDTMADVSLPDRRSLQSMEVDSIPVDTLQPVNAYCTCRFIPLQLNQKTNTPGCEVNTNI